MWDAEGLWPLYDLGCSDAKLKVEALRTQRPGTPEGRACDENEES